MCAVALENMLSFTRDGRRFSYRVAALIIHDERVLLCTAPGDGFWFLPGGRVEFFEPGVDCLRREMREELGEDVELGPLLWVAENFFEHEGLRQHEIGLYWRAYLRPGSPLRRRKSPLHSIEAESGAAITIAWHDLSSIDGLYLVPEFLKDGVKQPPDSPRYVVHWDIQPESGKSRKSSRSSSEAG
jgi:8-oxo-dGTP pyrophosphatase MutT (NUDIX family)